MTNPLTDVQPHDLLLLAAMFYPIYLKELSIEMAKEQYTSYLRSELRRRAIREAVELYREYYKQRDAATDEARTTI